MSRKEQFATQIFNLFGAPFVVERSDKDLPCPKALPEDDFEDFPPDEDDGEERAAQ